VLGLSTVEVCSHNAGTYPPMSDLPVHRARRSDRFAGSGIEPTIEELLSDPLTAAVMRRDGVTEDGLRALITSTRRTLLSRQHVA